jgi:hypothetical protein
MPVILTTHEIEMGSITVQGQPEQNVHETPISIKRKKKKLGLLACTCDPSYVGSINCSSGKPGHKCKILSLKLT